MLRICCAPLRNRPSRAARGVGRRFCKPQVAGSSPAGGFSAPAGRGGLRWCSAATHFSRSAVTAASVFVSSLAPRLRLFENHAPDTLGRRSLSNRLEGDPVRGVNRPAIGAVVRVSAVIEGRRVTQTKAVPGPGGRQGKRHTRAMHFAIGDEPVETVEIRWPGASGTTATLSDVDAGRRTARFGDGGQESAPHGGTVAVHGPFGALFQARNEFRNACSSSSSWCVI